ncbi:MAG: hypothetical protein K8F52_06030 [Candidatus Scalindua rubra]|uniref:Phosphate-selective porin O and P n=1 Tax=Candidatus Scalindua brodae TaxID=237368 RepID=A0A0B0ENP5_9BACT|nr:MAG: hypothetical protein SCABRO_00532 [Candidatus Scalindua brodae]MBZ0108208.1 hypothetical protein [Candidatus Scalindua rubra]TWU33472.1 hypothetical protein S225a_13590 [Candidatus Brocadiaceae bacterium S225]
MKKYTIMFLCLVALFFTAVCPGVYGQGSNDDLESKVEKMEKMLNELKGQLKEQTKATNELKAMRDEIKNISAPDAPSDDFYWTKKSQELVDKGLAPVFGNQYGKSFLRRFGRNTYIGGYMDHELVFTENGEHSFDQHRLIPFIYSDVSDRVKFATEIEIEHGGPDGSGGIQEKSGEIKIEFATIDFLMTDWLNYRGGIILSPLGKFNLVHDSPLQDLTERPMVSTRIIPTTLSESGMGFFGTFYPSETSKLDYEIYAVNGFSVEDAGTAADGGLNFIRDSRGSQQDDNNRNPAIVGRVAYSPFLGLEVGLSAHTGNIDEHSSNRMTIKAVDWTYQRGAFELVGEYAHASIERDGNFDAVTPNSDKYNGDMWGYYVEPRYHFMPQFLKDIAPTFFTDNSTFTGVVRLGGIDINRPTPGSADLRQTRLTPGINFRYTEDTVFKAEYQMNWESDRSLDDAEVSNNSLIFSVATYF